ncbi:MAG: hypothetical protein A2087_03290 [Spirochaetes bacterium GWD1_61_31]|nr:MAG: hypothetical protein A2Y37_05870 [Spirochaetes bacterium GWB1_60_80]OHD33788.1 MAG: hypothetical protein A2004_08815 [Spirochaetes bacterium GWC1_61_12]OHD35470.1 MAG: hypothetical protein A2087_03290 [Spirochaetes bacterium GWD1_61_31]OHD41535.1 MAG: hypothetical protein A2Y35_09650 [Spirochaetes bacterium GWE1_60_18]OHD61435.1 MAG: hypothetical protein A2Y32_09725 [Spirochaetes bacterium GWF1_60_12]HAP44791.1 hypothetical protein [Spirochaetaceae bacterium]
MKHEAEFRERCALRGLGEAAIATALEQVKTLAAFLASRGCSLERPLLAEVEAHVAGQVLAGGDDPAAGGLVAGTIMALARYFAVARQEAISIRLLAYLLPIGVLPVMAQRLAEVGGDAAHR